MQENTLIASDFRFSINLPEDAIASWHQELEVMYILQGTGVLKLDDNQFTYEVRQDDIIVLNSYQLHALDMQGSGKALSLFISPAFLAAFCPEIESIIIECKSFLYPKEEQTRFNLLRSEFASVFQAFYKNESHLPILLRSRVGILLNNLVHNFFDQNKQKDPSRSSSRERLRKATDYIHRHYRENITLSGLATTIYLSSSYLSHLFQKQLGLTFTAYVTNVRLSQAVALLRSERTITDIASEVGFPSTNALIDAFKRRFGVTPGQYRHSNEHDAADSKENGMTSEGFSTDFSSLMRHLHQPDQFNVPPQVNEVHELHVDTGHKIRTLSHNWRTLVNAGYAKDLLNGAVQAQIRKLQKEIGFRYMRCKGLLDDDMMLYVKKMSGSVDYNFVYVDEVLDFMRSVELKPYVEFSYMPSALAREAVFPFKRPSILSMPEQLNEWLALVTSLVRHFIDRYGLESVREWRFAPFVSPEFSGYGVFTMEEYWVLYQETTHAIRAIDPQLHIVGPGSNIDSSDFISEFLESCSKGNCLPDSLALRAYHSILPGQENTGLQLMAEDEAFPLAASGDEQFLEHAFHKVKKLLRQRGFASLPVILEEWSNSIWQRDLCNDTAYKSAFLFKNILENYDQFEAMGYWSISDHMEEIVPSPDLFHGGFGLFTRGGMPKSCYRALQLLRYSGSNLIAEGDGYFITSSKGEIQIFLYNYCHYDTLYRYRHTTHLTQTERYNVFNIRNSRQYHIRLDGLTPGDYTERRYSVGPAGGSAFDEWLNMGAPKDMRPEEWSYLESRSLPLFQVHSQQVTENFVVNAVVQPHEVQVIRLTR
ncbi:helix-turn-helix domain-containing protein [Acinetobacter sp. CUI P1]|nr:helix-turn-helix domain-containing protein [Acinetobacter sp. CUI P1]